MSWWKVNPVNRCMALLVALGVGAAGALALAYGLCRFYRTREISDDRHEVKEEKLRLIDPDESDSEGDPYVEESGAEDNERDATKVEQQAEDNKSESGTPQSDESTQDSVKEQISPYDENLMVYEFGPLPEDTGTYIVTPTRNSTPKTNTTTKLASHEVSPKSAEPLPSDLQDKLTEDRKQEVESPDYTSLPPSDAGEVLDESNPVSSNRQIPVVPAEPREKAVEKEVETTNEEEKNQDEISQLPSDTDNILDQLSSKNSSEISELPVRMNEKELQKNMVEDTSERESKDEISQAPDTSQTLAQASTESPNSHHGIEVMPAELTKKVAEKRVEDSIESSQPPSDSNDISDQSTSQSPTQKSPPPVVAPKPKPKSGKPFQSPPLAQPTFKSPKNYGVPVLPVEVKEKVDRGDEDESAVREIQKEAAGASSGSSFSKSPNCHHGIPVMPVGLAEKLAERKRMVDNGVESDEETSEPVAAARQESPAHSGVSLDDPVQVSPLPHLTRNKGPVRRPPTSRTPSSPVM